MDWQLLDYAKEAEETAAKLNTFVNEIPQFRKDITGDIAELYAISSALQALHEELQLPTQKRYAGQLVRDLDVCLPTLGYTLEDVRDIFNKTRKRSRLPGAFPGTPPYATMWEDALSDFKIQGVSLPQRLEYFRLYLQEMFDSLQGKDNDEEMARIRARLKKLLKQQEPMDSYFKRLSINGQKHAKTPKPPSPRIARPNIQSFQSYPTYHHSAPPPPPPPPRLPPRPTSSVYAGIGDIPMFVPPVAPEIPHSPTFSNTSSQGYSSHSNDSGGPVAHWAMRILDGRHTSTPFQTLAQHTICLGRDEPGVMQLLEDDGFEKVLELPFEATNVWVRLYWRSADDRARILFLAMDPDGTRRRHCFTLTGLAFRRSESCLQLCRVNRKDGHLDLWARLRFPLYERMVLFYCTAVAMKSQDKVTVAPGLEDFFNPGEVMEFSGEISDSSLLHAFRVYRDEDSGCVRFEATPRRGQRKNIPIWTAFVTKYIGRRSWMKRVGTYTVQFRELHPYVFCDGYKVPKGPTGKFELRFSEPDDVKDFIEVFHRIGLR